MAVITRVFSEVDGAIAEASSINRVIDDLYTLQNGNINSANLAAGAIGAAEIESGIITFNKLDYETTILIQEVF